MLWHNEAVTVQIVLYCLNSFLLTRSIGSCGDSTSLLFTGSRLSHNNLLFTASHFFYMVLLKFSLVLTFLHFIPLTAHLACP